uniref:Uncharacterized protein n=1 Tax=Anguilla anguilla TaxID=7936 RepID=A0A0E9R3G7_ANGAN
MRNTSLGDKSANFLLLFSVKKRTVTPFRSSFTSRSATVAKIIVLKPSMDRHTRAPNSSRLELSHLTFFEFFHQI